MKNLIDNLTELNGNELREINGGSEREDSKSNRLRLFLLKYFRI